MKIGAAVLVIVAVAALLWYNWSSSSGNSSLIKYDNVQVSSTDMANLESIASNMTLADQIGTGAIATYPARIHGKNLTINGKPAVLYIGADYCPYCAAGRWGLAIALMRFGSISGLDYMTSSASDVYPSTPTFTFANTTYQSSYISFAAVETLTNTYQPLQTPAAWQTAAESTYDTGGIPFIDFGNRSVQSGANFQPGLLDNHNWQYIISQISNPSTTLSQSVIGSADVFTAQICNIDNFTPASVCSAPYVKNILSVG